MTSVSCFQNEEVHRRLLGVCGSCTLSVCIVELIIFWMSLLCTSQTVLLLFLAHLREIRITEMFESVNVSHSVTSYSATPGTEALQAPVSMELSRQEYWSGLPFPSPWDLPHPGIEPCSSALQANSLLSEPLRKPTEMRGSPKLKEAYE